MTTQSPATPSIAGARGAGTVSGTTGIFSGLTCGTPYTLAVDAFDVGGQ